MVSCFGLRKSGAGHGLRGGRSRMVRARPAETAQPYPRSHIMIHPSPSHVSQRSAGARRGRVSGGASHDSRLTDVWPRIRGAGRCERSGRRVARDIQRFDPGDRSRPELVDDEPLGSACFCERVRCDQWGTFCRYTPYLVTDRAPARTSANAAAIQAAYATLLKLYPAQATTLTDAPGRVDRSGDGRRASRICRARRFLGPIR